MSTNNTNSGGLGIAGVATVVLIILKLAEVGAVATWSWWVVLLGPSLVQLAFVLGVALLIWIPLGVTAGFVALSEWHGRRKIQKMVEDTRS